MTKKAYDKARTYMLKRKRFTFVKDFVHVITSSIIIVYEILPMSWAHVASFTHLDETLRNSIWYLAFTTCLSILYLPLTIYEVFVIEYRRGDEFLAWHKLKTFIWSQIILMIISSALVMVIQRGDEVLIQLWITLCVIIFLVGTLYPLLAPSKFRQLTRLPEGSLRTKIFNLASDLHFPLKEIFIEERFKRPSCQIIYFYGDSITKNIVLCDQLIAKDEGDGCSDEEILALVAYEFSHWYYNQAFKYVVALEVNLTFYFGAFYFLFKNPQIYQTFGFVEERPILVGVYVVLKYAMGFYSTILSFLFLQVSRYFIKQNDRFVTRMGKGEELVRALVRLEKMNSAFPVYDWLYSAWHHDKPGLIERIANIRNDDFKFE